MQYTAHSMLFIKMHRFQAINLTNTVRISYPSPRFIPGHQFLQKTLSSKSQATSEWGFCGYSTRYLQTSNHALNALKIHYLRNLWKFFLVPLILSPWCAYLSHTSPLFPLLYFTTFHLLFPLFLSGLLLLSFSRREGTKNRKENGARKEKVVKPTPPNKW